jgi:two-component system cell cycle sensor histidine kinase/response regulator CckA
MMKQVLVLEDDRCVLELLCLILQSNGYLVLAAGTAEEALQQAARCNAVIDLLIADMVLTVSTGVRVGLKLKQHMPQLKLLIVSGYPEDIWLDRTFADLKELASDAVAILPKPFRPDILVERVRELIGV